VTAVGELWAYRNLIVNLTQRELKSRYKKSILGWLWSLLNPASVLVVYTLVFGFFFKSVPPVAGNGHTTAYALYLFAGLWVWNCFNGTVTGAITALQSSGTLLNKVYFPPACPAIANAVTVVLQALIESAILLAIMIPLGNVGWSLLLYPFLLVCIVLFSMVVGLALSVYNVFYRDVHYLVTIGMNVLFYATPIIYPITLVEQRSQTIADLIMLNPISQYVAMSRDIFWSLRWPDPLHLLLVPVVSVVIFALGLFVFNRKSRDIAQEL